MNDPHDVYLDTFDDSHDDSWLGIEKKNTAQKSVERDILSENEKMGLTEFDELATFINGIRLLAPSKVENVTTELGRELWKMRIADPVSYQTSQKSEYNLY